MKGQGQQLPLFFRLLLARLAQQSLKNPFRSQMKVWPLRSELPPQRLQRPLAGYEGVELRADVGALAKYARASFT